MTQVHNGIHHMPLGSHKVQCMIFPSDEKWLVAIGQCEFVTIVTLHAKNYSSYTKAVVNDRQCAAGCEITYRLVSYHLARRSV